MATHYSIPAWRIPMDRRAWQVGYSSWIAKSGTHRATKHSTAQQPTKHASPPPSLSLLPYPLSLHSLFPSLSPSLPLPLLPLPLPLSNAFSLLVLACIGDFKVIAFQAIILKNLQITNAGQCVEKREPFYIVGGKVNWCSHYGKQYGGSSKKQLPYDPAIPFLGIYLDKTII